MKIVSEKFKNFPKNYIFPHKNKIVPLWFRIFENGFKIFGTGFDILGAILKKKIILYEFLITRTFLLST